MVNLTLVQRLKEAFSFAGSQKPFYPEYLYTGTLTLKDGGSIPVVASEDKDYFHLRVDYTGQPATEGLESVEYHAKPGSGKPLTQENYDPIVLMMGITRNGQTTVLGPDPKNPRVKATLEIGQRDFNDFIQSIYETQTYVPKVELKSRKR